MKRYLLPLVIFLAMAVLLGVGLTLNPSVVPSPLIDKAAPPFEGQSLFNGQRTLTEQDLKGRVAAVNVWASWCTACLEEHPFIAQLSEVIPVYGLNYKDDREDALDWLSTHGNAYTDVIVDRKGGIGLDWGVYGVPETFILDAKGIIRHKHIGAITEESLKKKILPLVRRLKGEAS